MNTLSDAWQSSMLRHSVLSAPAPIAWSWRRLRSLAHALGLVALVPLALLGVSMLMMFALAKLSVALVATAFEGR